MFGQDPSENQLTYKRIIKSWWPLAASWLLMSISIPGVSAVIARLPDPVINLAAYGGISHPISLIIESPIIMMLSASTTLNRDWNTYKRLFRFMMLIGFLLTCVHFLVAFTPLYYFVVEELIGAPQAIVESGRLGLMCMLPWTWSIVYRKFHQGILIRYGHSDAVAFGTVVRLLAIIAGITVTIIFTDLPGVAVGSIGHVCGVFFEALYTHFRAQPVILHQVKLQPAVEKLKWMDFAKFYIPLAMTPFLTYIWQPIGSAGLSRMPNAIDSLAIWAVLSGLILILNSTGLSYNEIVIAILDRSGSYPVLKRFTAMMAGIGFGAALLIAATPLAGFWFREIAAISPHLSQIAIYGFWLLVPVPGLMYALSFFQGIILNSRKTRPIPEAVFVYLLISVVFLTLGVLWGKIPGVYVIAFTFTLANMGQVGWMGFRSRPAARNLKQRDEPVLVGD